MPRLNDWDRLIKEVKRVMEYGVHCNDLSLPEIESSIQLALAKYAKAKGLPIPDWRVDEEETDT